MKKSYLLITAAALVFAACSDIDSYKEIKTPEYNNAINFTTFTSKQTRADNSGADDTKDLKAYNTTFRLWGNKYVGASSERTAIFGVAQNDQNQTIYPGEKVEYKETAVDLIGNWAYDPVRFWDKTATKYDFYAASPFEPQSAKYENNAWTTETKTWVINDGNNPKTISLVNFRVSGTNMATDFTNTEIKADKVMATVDTEDLMISSDITNYTDFAYSTAPNTNGVQLVFNHILSRLNIGVRKSDDLANFTVLLNSIKIYNMKSLGSFDEAQTLPEGETLAGGTQARWTKDDNNTDKFTPGKMAFETQTEITRTVTSGKYQYVYEGLIMPQKVLYSKTVLVNEANKPENHFTIDGSDAVFSGEGTWSAPFIVIDFEIGKTKTEGDNQVYTKIDSYKYYFNLADVFNGSTESPVDFCEGWQNTLNITLAPTAIKFVPVVYNWDEKYPTGDTDKSGEFTIQ